MGQEFHVVRCFSCLTFQVHQVKKATRWTCKLCGQKQSLLKEFARGSGADCRRHVQKLNAMRGAVMEVQRDTWLLCEQEDAEEEEGEEEPRDHQVDAKQASRWSKYLHPAEKVEPSGLMDRTCLHGNSTRKRPRAEDKGQDDIIDQTPEQPNCPKLRPSAGTTSPPRLPMQEAPSVCGRSQTSDDVTGPRPHLPVRSMFESGEDFDFDEFL